MDVEAVIKLAVLLAFAGTVVYHAVAGPPRLMAWAMFAHAVFCRIDAWTEDAAGRRPFNQWAFIPNQDLLMDIYRLDDFLDFVQTTHGVAPSGVATLVHDDRKQELRLVDGGVEV